MAEMKLEGMDILTKELEKMGKKAGRIENKALKEGAEIILKEAKKNVPVKTGNLREGLEVSGVKRKGDERYVDIGITKGDNSEIFYGKFIEWGTEKMQARPFLQPAFENNKKEVEQVIIRELKKGLVI